jgi:hypothetical protein
MHKLRKNTRQVIYIIFGFIILIIFLSIVFQLLGARNSDLFVNLINTIASYFTAPFSGAFTSSGTNLIWGIRLNFDAIVAMFSYLFVAIFLGELITAFMYEKFRDVIQNFIDAMFKFISFTLFIRILIDLFSNFAVSTLVGIIQFIYFVTAWSTGLVSNFNFLGLTINLSTIIWLVIVSFTDSQFEKVLDAIFDFFNFGNNKVNFVKPLQTITKNVIYVVRPTTVKKIIQIPQRKVKITQRDKQSEYKEAQEVSVKTQEFISDNR